MIGNGFSVNIAVIGEMSCGKSTFVNAILGDCLAEVGSDRSTKIMQRYYECEDVKTNENVLSNSKKGNEKEDERLQQQRDEYQGVGDAQYLKIYKQARNTIFTREFIYHPKFNDHQGIKTHKVKPSDLVPRESKSILCDSVIFAFDNFFETFLGS